MRTTSPKRRGALPAKRLVLAVVLLTALLSPASPAGASAVTTIVERCVSGQPLSGFSQQEYREALANLPTEVEEYSNCANLIRHAELAAAGGGSGAESASAAAAPVPLTPTERTALNSVPKVGVAPIQVGNQVVRPGVIHADIASAVNTLPSPLLAILAFLFVCALLLAGRAIGNRVRARRAR
jgi:hypothetical protein